MSSDEPPTSQEALHQKIAAELFAEIRDAKSSPAPDPYWPESTPSSLPRWQALFLEVLRGIVGRTRNPDHPLMKIGDFEVEWPVGNGGHGCVYRVRDMKLDRLAALKLCAVSSPAAAEALMAEARVLAKLRHPNIVTVYAMDTHGEQDVFFVMEYIDGLTLAKYAYEGEGRPPWEELVELFCLVGETLSAAHDAGVVHGDFKPSNVMLERETHTPYIVDFGVARIIGSEQEGGGGRGTLHYMAPEVLRGGVGDARCDQYSFCVALWQCLDGGWPPYGGNDNEQLLDDIEVGFPPINNQAVPERVREILRKGLSFDPEQRYTDMPALVHALRLTLGPRLVVEPQPAGQKSKTNTGLVVLVIMLSVGLLLQYLRPEGSSLEQAQLEQSVTVDDVEQREPPSEEEKQVGLLDEGQSRDLADREKPGEQIEGADAVSASDCEQTSWKPSLSAEGVCTLIGVHKFVAAHELWVTSHGAANPRSESEWVSLIHDVLSISKTFEAAGEDDRAVTWRTNACNDYKKAQDQDLSKEAEELLSSALGDIDCN